MAITATARGTGGNNTGALTLVCSPTTTIGANSMAVLVIAVDNAGPAGSTAIAPSSITDSVGNTWTLRRDDVFDNGAASAGAEIVIYTGWITTQITSSNNVTVELERHRTAHREGVCLLGGRSNQRLVDQV